MCCCTFVLHFVWHVLHFFVLFLYCFWVIWQHRLMPSPQLHSHIQTSPHTQSYTTLFFKFPHTHQCSTSRVHYIRACHGHDHQCLFVFVVCLSLVDWLICSALVVLFCFAFCSPTWLIFCLLICFCLFICLQAPSPVCTHEWRSLHHLIVVSVLICFVLLGCFVLFWFSFCVLCARARDSSCVRQVSLCVWMYVWPVCMHACVSVM